MAVFSGGMTGKMAGRVSGSSLVGLCIVQKAVLRRNSEGMKKVREIRDNSGQQRPKRMQYCCTFVGACFCFAGDGVLLYGRAPVTCSFVFAVLRSVCKGSPVKLSVSFLFCHYKYCGKLVASVALTPCYMVSAEPPHPQLTGLVT